MKKLKTILCLTLLFYFCATHQLFSFSCSPPVFFVSEDCYGYSFYDIEIYISDFGTGNPNGYSIAVDAGNGPVATGINATQDSTYILIPGNYPLSSNLVISLIGLDNASCTTSVNFTADCSCIGNQPLNDECFSALDLNIGSSPTLGSCTNFIVNGPFSNACATAGFIGYSEFEPIGNFAYDPISNPSGWFSSGGVYIDKTLWFEIDGTGGVVHIELETAGLADPIVNGQMAVFASCPSFYYVQSTLLAYTDISNTNSNGNSISFPTELGETYKLIVDHQGLQSNAGSFNLLACSEPESCTITANAFLQTDPCVAGNQGVFNVTANIVYENIAGQEIVVFANSIPLDTLTVNPIVPPATIGVSTNNTITVPNYVVGNSDLTIGFQFLDLVNCYDESIIDQADVPNCCANILNISNQIVTSTYQANDFIFCNGQVDQNSNGPVYLYAGFQSLEFVELSSGFIASGEVDFEVENIPCTF